MAQRNPIELAIGAYKEIEQQIIEFYLQIARKNQIDLKMTEIFAYLKIYRALTQKQLKKLTQYSAGFISMTLKSFLRNSIVTRNFIPNTHTNIYTVSEEYIFTIVSPRAEVNRKLEQHDKFIIELQNKVKSLQNKYPLETTFFLKRLNGIRNYIETQRRVYSDQKERVFLNENVTGLLPKEEFIVYPPEIKELESSLVDRFVQMEMFVENDPIINRILTYLITRERISQEQLLKLTGFSRSTISRNLSGYGKQDYVSITKKEYLKPRFYYMGSIGVYLTEVILNNSRFLVSWLPKFTELLSELELKAKYNRNEEMKLFFQAIITQIISEMKGAKLRLKNYELVQQKLKENVY